MEGIQVLRVQKFCCSAKNCLKEYSTKFNLKVHFHKKHLGIKKFECSLCGNKFVSMLSMREHTFIHTREKPYKCQVCGMKFRQLSFLSLHKKSHLHGYKESLDYTEKYLEDPK